MAPQTCRAIVQLHVIKLVPIACSHIAAGVPVYQQIVAAET